jgi:non-ribosomal peptide synthetase component F
LLAHTRQMALQAYAHQDLPFEKLVAELQPERDLSRQALFQVMFVMQNMPFDSDELARLGAQTIQANYVAAKFDATVNVYETADGLRGWIEYATDLFDESTIERFVNHYTHVLEQVVARPDALANELRLETEAERHELLVEWNQTAQAYRTERCVHELFTEQAARTPDAVAVTYEGLDITYAELDRRSSQFAHYLKSLGVGPERVVALCVERSPEMVIEVLGILKAGGAYLPLDPTYPASRLTSCGSTSETSWHKSPRPRLSIRPTPATSPTSSIPLAPRVGLKVLRSRTARSAITCSGWRRRFPWMLRTRYSRRRH